MGAENSKASRLSRCQANTSEFDKIRRETEKARQGRSKTVQCEKLSRQSTDSLVVQQEYTTRKIWGGKFVMNKTAKGNKLPL